MANASASSTATTSSFTTVDRNEHSVSPHHVLARFLRDSVRCANGIVAAECWMYDPSSEELTRPRGGFYLEQGYLRDKALPEEKRAALEWLADQSLVSPQQPGVGLAGLLYAESTEATSLAVTWRSMEEFIANPEVVVDERMERSSAVFGQVAAVRLGVDVGHGNQHHHGHHGHARAAHHHHKGLLLVYARSSASMAELGDARNTAFIQTVGVVGGGILSMITQSEVLKRAKRSRQSGWRKLRFLIKTGFLRGAIDRERERQAKGGPKIEAPKKRMGQRCSRVAGGLAWAAKQADKARGAKAGRAPKLLQPLTTTMMKELTLTWVGIAATLLALSGMDQYMVGVTDGATFVMMGSFGALLTLQFGAHNSPLVQPRNIFLGNMLAAAVAVLFHYLSGSAHLGIMPRWVAIALAPATAITATGLFHVLHPPAGAAALIFIAGAERITSLGWLYLLCPLLLGNAVCTCIAVLVNNLSPRRQYPVYWWAGRGAPSPSCAHGVLPMGLRAWKAMTSALEVCTHTKRKEKKKTKPSRRSMISPTSPRAEEEDDESSEEAAALASSKPPPLPPQAPPAAALPRPLALELIRPDRARAGMAPVKVDQTEPPATTVAESPRGAAAADGAAAMVELEVESTPPTLQEVTPDRDSTWQDGRDGCIEADGHVDPRATNQGAARAAMGGARGALRRISKEALRVHRRSNEVEPSYARVSPPEEPPRLQTLFRF